MASNIEEFLAQDERKDLLRLLTAGSVDDGKSTLIGRLLFDSKRLYEVRVCAVFFSSVKETRLFLPVSGSLYCSTNL